VTTSDGTRKPEIPAEVVEELGDLEVEFNREIQTLLAANNSVLDSIIHFCSVRQLEIDAVVDFIKRNLNIYAKLQSEGEMLRFLKPTIRLPI
jgi:hypothetical protein